MASINSLSSQQTPVPVVVVMVSTAGRNTAASTTDEQTAQLANALFGNNSAKNPSLNGMSHSMDLSFSGLMQAASVHNAVKNLVSSDATETDILSRAIFKTPATEMIKNANGADKNISKPTDKKDLESKLNDLLSNDPTKPLADNQDVMDLVNNANPSDVAEVIAKVATGSKLNNKDEKEPVGDKQPAAPPVQTPQPAPPPPEPPKVSAPNRSQVRGGGSGARVGMNVPQTRGSMNRQAEEPEQNRGVGVNPDSVDNVPSNPDADTKTPPVAEVPKADPPRPNPPIAEAPKDADPKTAPPPAGGTTAASATLTQDQLDKLPKLNSEVKTAFEQAQGPLHSALKATQNDLLKAGFGNVSASDLLNGTAKAK